MTPQDAKRVRDVTAALKRAKPGAFLALEDLAMLWGTTKAPFVTQRKHMTGFPEGQRAPKEMGLSANSHVYPAREALEAMLAYARRHETAAKVKSARAAAIIGTGSDLGEAATSHSPNELQVLSRLAMDLATREREQRLYIPAAEVAAVAGDVFALVSEFCETLPNKIDPHGDLLPKVAVKLKERAAEQQLILYGKIRHLLSPDAVSNGNRETPDRARRTPTRRKRRGSVSVEAG